MFTMLLCVHVSPADLCRFIKFFIFFSSYFMYIYFDSVKAIPHLMLNDAFSTLFEVLSSNHTHPFDEFATFAFCFIYFVTHYFSTIYNMSRSMFRIVFIRLLKNNIHGLDVNTRIIHSTVQKFLSCNSK